MPHNQGNIGKTSRKLLRLAILFWRYLMQGILFPVDASISKGKYYQWRTKRLF